MGDHLCHALKHYIFRGTKSNVLRNWSVDGLINGVRACTHFCGELKGNPAYHVLSDSVLVVSFVAFKFHGPSAVV